TFSPYRTWVETLPPRCAIPWTSLIFTSKPSSMSAADRRFDAAMVPWPPTPTNKMFASLRMYKIPLLFNGLEWTNLIAERTSIAHLPVDEDTAVSHENGRAACSD